MGKPVFFTFNNKNSYEDFGINILNDVVIPVPQPKTNKVSIPGGEDLIEYLGGYEDISIPIKIDILNKNIIKRKYRDIKSWLGFYENNKLIFSDDTEVYYRVKEIQIPNFTTEFSECGSTTINFICSPYCYFLDGANEIPIPEKIFNNNLIPAMPILKIKAEGLVTITINNNSVELNVGQGITIDVERELIYKNDVLNNSLKKGAWSNLYLNPGLNTITYTCDGTFNEITIIPNWRCL